MNPVTHYKNEYKRVNGAEIIVLDMGEGWYCLGHAGALRRSAEDLEALAKVLAERRVA